jgi:hypothetical protein
MGNRVDIHNFEQAISLGRWCKDNLENDEWHIELLNMVPPHYKFDFKDSHTSTLAVLSS